jgi:hypothetical protein
MGQDETSQGEDLPGSEASPDSARSAPADPPAETLNLPGQRRACSTGDRPPGLETILRELDQYFIQETLKRLRPQEEERKPS